MMSLGKYPIVSLADARRKRDEAQKLNDAGKNPMRERQIEKLRIAKEGENTFERVSRHWFELKQKGLNDKYCKQNLARIKQYVFPKIGVLPISDITIPDVVHVIEVVIKHGIVFPLFSETKILAKNTIKYKSITFYHLNKRVKCYTIETAKRLKQLISQIFRYAAQRGMYQHNPAADLRDIFPTQEEAHHACIHPSEIPKLFTKIEFRDNDFTKYAMKLLAFTFVRTRELIGAK